MPTPEIGIEATKAVGFTSLGMVLLKAVDLVLKKVERYRSLKLSETDESWKTAASMREELRKDNEALRARISAAEQRVDALEDELHKVRSENEELRRELERVETAMRVK